MLQTLDIYYIFFHYRRSRQNISRGCHAVVTLPFCRQPRVDCLQPTPADVVDFRHATGAAAAPIPPPPIFIRRGAAAEFQQADACRAAIPFTCAQRRSQILRFSHFAADIIFIIFHEFRNAARCASALRRLLFRRAFRFAVPMFFLSGFAPLRAARDARRYGRFRH